MTRQDRTSKEPSATVHEEPETLKRVLEAVKGVKYGVVQLIIQDGKIVQIDKTEKTRLV